MQKMKMHTSNGSKIHKVHKGIAQVCITAEIHGEIHEIIEATEALFIQQRQEHVASVVVGQIAQHHLGVIKVSRSSRSIQIQLPCLLFTSVSLWIACIAYIAQILHRAEAPSYVQLCCLTPQSLQLCRVSPVKIFTVISVS